ncbi:MAG: hypothetical protein IJP95_04460 [Bacteroidales bacterium]|nr:hypothetical protein [Bacteroidales bacterium]
MKDNAREFILKNLRQALSGTTIVATKPPMPPAESHFRLEHNPDMVLNFAQKYMMSGGVLNYAASNGDVADVLNAWIRANNIKDIDCGTLELSQFLQNLDLETRNFSAIGDQSHYGVLLCECLVAWNGSVVITSNCFQNKEKIVIPENTVLVAFSSQVARDLKSYTSPKGKEDSLPKQTLMLYPENLDHSKTQLLLIEDQN